MLAGLTGLLLGAWHVFSGPDHLAAMGPLAMAGGGSRKPWLAGLAWGLGHASGVWLIGLLLLGLGTLLPLEQLGVWSERLVGVLIVGVGGWGFWRMRHPVEGHGHRPSRSHSSPAFAIGAVHGVAGSSHLYGVLPALALALASGERGGYLVGFGVGSVIAMVGFAALLGELAQRLPGSRERVRTWALGVASGAAIGIGLTWLVVPT